MIKNESHLREFVFFLKNQGCSPITCKNYAADINHFLKFLDAKRATEFSQELFSAYRRFLTTTPLSLKTLNRKLSALRKFGDYLAFSKTFSSNPTSHIKNITPLAKKVARVKSFPSLFHQSKTPQLFFVLIVITFLINFFLTPQPPPPQSPPAGPPAGRADGQALLSSSTPTALKTLRFQSQLTDSKGNPKTSLTLATFKLWDQKTGGNQLYATDYCFLKPDQNGLFSIVIGQSCGKEIPTELFNKYQKIYLEMNVAGAKRVRTEILNTAPSLLLVNQGAGPTPTPEVDDQVLEKILARLTSVSTSSLPTPTPLRQGDLEINGKIIDGGLGIYGSTGRKLPSTFDFTKGLILEFDFQTGRQDFEALLSPETAKSYYFSWTKNNDFSIGKITAGLRDEFLKVDKPWEDDAWFHGKIALQQSVLSFKVSGTSVSAPLDIQGVPLTKTGTISFSGVKNITNLRIFTSEVETLASGDAKIEGSLSVSGNLQANLSGIESTNEVCWQGGVDGATLVTCSSGTDLAEYYETAEDVEEGDIVSITNNQTTEDSSFSIAKSSRPYDPNLIGVVSTLPWRIMGRDTPNSKPVALTGRVPIKVKGEVAVGDPLTSSLIPGIAQKATEEGLILGRALEDFTPLLDTQEGKILVFLNISWYKPNQ